MIVLSTPEQLYSFQKIADFHHVTVYCDNEALFPLLVKSGIVFTSLDEFLIRDQWSAFNSWGCTKSTGWIGLSRHLTPEGQPDVLPGIFLFFACSLIAAAKNLEFAKYLIRVEKPSEIIVFNKNADPVFPAFSGNAFLNYFLKTLADDKKIPLRTLDIAPVKSSFPNGSGRWRTTVRRSLGNVIITLFSRFPKKSFQKHLVVYGALRHLASVVDFLHQKGIPILIYDHEFHGRIFSYAAIRGIPYVTADHLPTPSPDAVKKRSEQLNDQLLAKFAAAESVKHFRWEDYHFADFIRNVILPSMPTYFDRVAEELFRYEDILKNLSVAGCLVDEDFGFRANFCEYLKYSGKDVFCISHAQGAYDFDAEPDSRSFSQSMTFVNSEHEKIKMYGSLGWDLSRVVVTGTPRYDRLFRLAKQFKPRSTFPKRILYCPGCFSPHTPDMPGFLGLDVFSYKSFQEIAFRRFVEASEGLPIEIVVKSHYHSDDAIWLQNVKTIKTRIPIKIYKHSADFHSLLAESHAMVLPSLSTSLVEAALCRVPVIFMGLDSQNSPAVSEFAAHGFCRFADSIPAARQELLRIVTAVRKDALSQKDDPQREYYLGKEFGSATEKIGGIIISRLNEVLSCNNQICISGEKASAQ